MLATLAQWVQSTQLSQWLAGSTWGYPVAGAVHVLGIAWFGGAVLASMLGRQPRSWFVWAGAAFLLLTGVLLFIVEPAHCVESKSFWAKMALLAILVAVRPAPRSKAAISITLALWFGVLLASRGIAFF